MRALLLEKVPRIPGHEEMVMPLDEVLSALSLEAADFRAALDEAEALAEVRWRHPCRLLARSVRS